jgi:hypothetical protein
MELTMDEQALRKDIVQCVDRLNEVARDWPGGEQAIEALAEEATAWRKYAMALEKRLGGIQILSQDDAVEMLGEGIHTCLRTQDDSEQADRLWYAIHDSGPAWGTALRNFLDPTIWGWRIAVVEGAP